jgi:oxygen-independent coproporphyrinogen-3 oxidase
MSYLDQFPISLYLHIPFCATKCSYCAFNTYTHLEHLIDPFVQALACEIRMVGADGGSPALHTIFAGGGTPSLLSPHHFELLFEAINDSFTVLAGAEITLEANPNDITQDYLAALKTVGFNRISLGMQTANANELALFLRRHDNDAVARAVSAARHAGFDSLNLDLIYGFPHQTLASWEGTLDQALALKPDHVSLYALGLEDNTPMKAWVMGGRLPAPDDDLAADMYDLASDRLAADGYGQYEISNWAREGKACRHNLQYWLNYPYIGVGPGAHGWAGSIRYATLLSPQRYIQRMRESEDEFVYPRTPVTETATIVDTANEISETLMMGLRLTQRGIVRDEFQQRFDIDLLELHGETLRKYADYGLLEIDDETVRLTQAGRLLSNAIFRELV